MNRRHILFMKSLLLGLALMLITWLPAAADDASEQEAIEPLTLEEMVVTATRIKTPLEETTKSVEVVDSQEMEEQQEYWLPELLDNEPGVFMRTSGGLGQFSQISIRGAGTRTIQFQYNGMPLRDAADTQDSLSYFIEDLYGGTNLDQVEVLKGPNSTLYGSHAMGGVINIIPKKWQRGLSAELRSKIGPNSTYINNARLAYGQEKYYFDFNPIYLTTDGEDYGGKYGYYYDNKGGTFGAGFKPSNNCSLEFSGLMYDTDIAMGSTPSLDASGNLIKNQAYQDQHRESKLYQLGLVWNQQISPLWDYSIKASHGETERHYFWSTIPGDQSNYDGETRYIEMQHNLYISESLTLNIGGNYEKEVYDGQEPNNPGMGDYTPVFFDEEWKSWDAFAQAQLAFMDRSLFLNFGGRYNNPDEFDDETVWEASGAYILKSTGTKFHAHVGTGYRTPCLYETYGGFVWGGMLFTIGNRNLKPEENTGYEFGIDQSLKDGKVRLGATYFVNEFENLIGFNNATFSYYNINEAKTSGVEAYISVEPWPVLKLELAYTYTDAKSKSSSASEWVRSSYQPRNKADLVATFRPTERLTIVGDISRRDEMIVPLYKGWTSVNWEEQGVTTIDLAGTYKMKLADAFMRIENLTNKDYTETGFCMPGRSIYAGVEFHF